MIGEIARMFVTVGAKIDEFKRGMREVKSGLGDMQRRINAAEAGSKMLAKGLGAIAVASGGLAIKSLMLSGEMEQTEVAFTTLLKSGEAAKNMLAELQTFSAQTPFQFPGLAQSARLLITMGMNAEDAVPAIKTIADAVAAAGGGQEEFMGVARALGQIQAKGKVSAEELMQLAERGIPAYEILREQLNLTGEEVANIGERGLSAERGISAILQGLTDRFEGTAAKQAQTLLGMWSTVKDNITLTLIPLGDIIADVFDVKDVMQTAIGWLEKFRGKLVDIRDTIEKGGVAAAMEKFVSEDTRQSIVVVAGAITGALAPAFIVLAKAIWLAVAPLLPWAAAGAAVAALGYSIYKAFKDIPEPVERTNEAVRDSYETFRDADLAGDALSETLEGDLANAYWTVQGNVEAVKASQDAYNASLRTAQEEARKAAQRTIEYGEAIATMRQAQLLGPARYGGAGMFETYDMMIDRLRQLKEETEGVNEAKENLFRPPPGGGGGIPGMQVAITDYGLVALRRMYESARALGHTMQTRFALSALELTRSMMPQPALATAGATLTTNQNVTVNHTGTIRVEGVNDSGQLVGVTETIIDDVYKDQDRYSNITSPRRTFR